MFALIDCNNFYVSCERVFNPNLNGKPVVVLSNNDGCAISRSDEAKQLGIPMGAPIFKYRSIINQHNVIVLSSNYPLYADMSNRIMTTISKFIPDVEIYSIDEAFLKFEGYENYDLLSYASKMRNTILKWTGIPTSVGIAPTKSLAKISNKIARKFPSQTKHVYVLDTDYKRSKALNYFPLNDIWGIGRRLSKRLQNIGCKNASDFVNLPEQWVKSNLSIVELKIQQELKGISNLDLDSLKIKKSIATTRSFEKPISNLGKLKERVSTFSLSCAEKLRRQNSLCNVMIVFIRSNYFRKDLQQHSCSRVVTLPYPTNSSFVLNNYALKAIENMFQDKIDYKKAGVIVTSLIPNNSYQLGIFENEDYRHKPLMKTMDYINSKYGEKIKLANQDLKRKWKMKQEFLSPCYTTKIDDIIKIK
tara:strand:+ start:2460 stop:3713 length:1254 start_codon:yes stop_codon:yes gene_type:complete